jgi:histidinol-phosphate aminotransferase
MSGLAERLARPEILALAPFDLATRTGASGEDAVRLDANECPFPALIDGPLAAELNRYPEPQPAALRARLAALYGAPSSNLLVTRGGDDAIDILIRAFCRPGEDAVVVCTPTFSAYAHFARLQGARVLDVPLDPTFAVDVQGVRSATRDDGRVKIIFLCSPNNPTGTVIAPDAVIQLAADLPDVLIVLDEAYIEFAEIDSLAAMAAKSSNLVVLRTLSKAWGLASARVGALVGPEDVLALAVRTLPPYPMPGPSVAAAMLALSPARRPLFEDRIALLRSERARMARLLATSPWLDSVLKGQGNFLFLRPRSLENLKARLSARGISARLRTNWRGDAVRLTIGTPAENDLALAAFGVTEPSAATRRAEVTRDTRETRIALVLDLDKAEPRRIRTGVGFYDHMLEQVAAHAGISLVLECEGDLEIDAHHTVEDCALALGSALKQALGQRKGIARYGFVVPMDEAQAAISLDLSGRPYCRFEGEFAVEKIGEYPTALTAHVFRSLADSLGASIHLSVTGQDDHHKTEACFKALGRALRQAVRVEGGEVPSTKGVL